MKIQRQHLTDELIGSLDAELDDAIGRVRGDEEQQVTVSLAFVVGRDKDGVLAVAVTQKAARTQKSSLAPGAAKQMRLEIA